ncbi:MAG: hypothetical protein HC822_27735 [Oscillochloris sp.]|nr:hypothetical protein [Oscillochloris sp.]
MDWQKQANEMVKTWTGTQQKVWESWLGSMQMMASPQSPEAWQKMVETWRGTVKQALEAQLEVTRMWAEGVASSAVNMPTVPTIPGMPNVPGMPQMSTSVVDWSRQMLELTRNWTETQVRFSENWFDLLKKAEPVNMTQNWDMDQAKTIMASWQDAAQKAIEAQTEFSKMMMSGATVMSGTDNKKK